MRMGMSLGMHHCIGLFHLPNLPWFGGVTTSVFKMFEEKLMESSQNQKVMKKFMKPVEEEAENYVSYMDWIYTCIFPNFKPVCQLFYERDHDEKLALRNIMSRESIRRMDEFLTNVLLRGAITASERKFKFKNLEQWNHVIEEMRYRGRVDHLTPPLGIEE